MTAAVPSYQFASKGYYQSFAPQPAVDAESLRAATVDYVKAFDKRAWYDTPIRTIIKGKSLTGGKSVTTVDAFGRENGAQIMATDEQAKAVLDHVKNYRPPKVDYREEIKRIDAEILSLPLAGQIIGNQALDFGKQDGITEVVESVEANAVEQRLNTALLEDEKAGNVKINRLPAFIGCVSNFSNFLDLCRKVMRNVELGIPVVVLSRSNTTQHMFRWFVLLLDLMAKEGVDSGMITYFSCDINQTTALFKANPESPAYFTCSREVAQAVKKNLRKTMCSTGGPNTMVATKYTPEVSTALRYSAMIENKGQCTAMRHFVLPECTPETVEEIFRSTPIISNVLESLESEGFAGLYADQKYECSSGYKALSSQPKVQWRMASRPPHEIEEKWRQPVVDVTAPSTADFRSEAFVTELCRWLIKKQPISLAVNGDDDLAMKLFEQTGLSIYTVGTLENPALTAQARPQDGECFGEFPPRSQLTDFTHLPVVIPSSTPGYNTEYTAEHLAKAARGAYPVGLEYCQAAFEGCSEQVLGFVKTLCMYLADACGPKRGYGYEREGARTSLFGLQRPPLLDGAPTVFRLRKGATMDELAPYLAPFYITNARSQLVLSVDAACGLAAQLAKVQGVMVVTEDESGFQKRKEPAYNVIVLSGEGVMEPILAMHWVSRLICMGHIKSVKTKDDAFLAKFSKSRKWLAIQGAPSKL